MNGQIDVFGSVPPDDRARARNTDPWTSHAAARNIPFDKLRTSQKAVYDCFRTNGPMHHNQLLAAYERGRRLMPWPLQSESGIRTRTKELVNAGYLRNSGRTVLLGGSRKRHSIVWEVSPS